MTTSRSNKALLYAISKAGVSANSAVPFTPPSHAPFLANLQPSDDDIRDYPFIPSGKTPLYQMDMRNEMSPIKNQGNAGACTAFHVTGHVERLAKLGGFLPTGGYSERANYNMSRQLLGLTGDSGTTLRAAIHAAYKYGLPAESVFPYSSVPSVINDLTVPADVMSIAAQSRIDKYFRIDVMFSDETVLPRRIERALADGFTVGIGMYLHYWFYYINGPLSTHAPLRNQPISGLESVWRNVIGAHAMVIQGVDFNLGGYILRNSWDVSWGDHGYYLMPFEDLGEAFEFWAVGGFNGSETSNPPYDLTSPESVAARIYRAVLNRYPDASGLPWATSVVSTSGPRALASTFLTSAEYLAQPLPSDTDFISLVYQHLLGRSPDITGQNYWLSSLASDPSNRSLLVVTIANSAEAMNRERP